MSEEITTGEYKRKWGLIFGLVSTIVFIITAASRLNMGLGGIALAWVVAIGMLVLGVKEFRTDNGGFVGFGKAFGIAFMIAIIGGVVRGVLQYVYVLIDPEFLIWQREVQENSGFGPPRDQSQGIPQSMQSFIDFTQSAEFIPIASIIGAIFAGLIFGAIVAAIVKNEADEF